ncbi:MAG: hypothetical protein KJ757_01555 [Planctomycetes bacterium]|nr:hypothetical protein [Planctomycetota bacterium]MBU1517912.1 hypothetical protein [Planctomycetota bacterium]MBU2596236.1 hypothetical protein [Planctomycetota bacterium]
MRIIWFSLLLLFVFFATLALYANADVYSPVTGGNTTSQVTPTKASFGKSITFWGSIAYCLLAVLGSLVAVVWLIKLVICWTGAGKAHKNMARKLNDYLDAIEENLGPPPQLIKKTQNLVKTIEGQISFGASVAAEVRRCLRTTLPDIFEELHEEGKVSTIILRKIIEVGRGDIVAKESRRKISDRGGDILKKSGMQDYIKIGYDELDKKMSKSLKSDEMIPSFLDVDEQAFAALNDKINEDTIILRTLENYVFEHTGVDLYDILYAGSVYLANEFLQKHPELDDEGSNGTAEGA